MHAAAAAHAECFDFAVLAAMLLLLCGPTALALEYPMRHEKHGVLPNNHVVALMLPTATQPVYFCAAHIATAASWVKKIRVV